MTEQPLNNSDTGRTCTRQGYLTIFLALSLTIILSLVVTLIEGARINAIRMQFEIANDIALNSCLAEFHRELQQQYDLFFIDTSYGSGAGAEENTTDHLVYYMDKNLQASGLWLFSDLHDFTACRLTDASITETRFAADNRAEALGEQITAYFSGEPVGELAANVLQLLDWYNGTGFDITAWYRLKAENDSAFQAVRDEWRSKQEKLAENDEEIPELSNPADAVDALRQRPLLNQIFGPSQSSISDSGTDTSQLLSHRPFHTGTGLSADNSHHYGSADSILFDEYVLEKCGTFLSSAEKNCLKYQAEYILFGCPSDRDNLERMAEKLLLVRLAANCMYLMSDSAKRAEARTFAFVISLFMLSPELTDIIATAILLAWSYLESIQDLRAIFRGKKVALVKSAATWKTSLGSIFSPDAVSDDEGSGHGFGYAEYLRVFLFLENRDMKNYRLMDIMEMDIRKTPGNASFCMDWCMDSFTASTAVESAYGYQYEMTRSITYN